MRTVILSARRTAGRLEAWLREAGHELQVHPLSPPRDALADAELTIVDLTEAPEAAFAALRDQVAAPVGERPLVAAWARARDCVAAIEAGADELLRADGDDDVLRARLVLLARRVAEAASQREAREELARSYANLTALLENTEDFIVFSDASGSPLFFNSAYAAVMKAMLGLDMAPGIKPHELLQDPEERAVWDEYHRRVLSGERFSGEFSYTPPDGRTLYFEVRYNPIREGDEVVGFSEFTRDVTERHEADAALRAARDELEQKVAERTAALEASNRALRESEDRYRSLYELAPLAMVLWDVEGRVTAVNSYAERLFGWPEEELKGLRWSELLAGVDQLEAAPFRATQILAGEEVAPRVVVAPTKDGREVLCEWRSTVLRTADGETIGALSLGLDVTQRVRTEERLRRAEKMEAIGQLAGGIAHDFNNQLVGVLGHADMLASALADSELRSHAEHIVRSATRSADLISQLLAFARKSQLVSRPVAIHGLLGEVQALLARSIDKRIEVEVELADEALWTHGDPSQLHSALLNLALNARDAMPDGGRLRMATRIVALNGGERPAEAAELPAGEYVQVSVSDTGSGIAPEVLSRIYEPFFTTKSDGTGMGLAAVYGTVTSHGGVIHVETAPGEGTCFDLLLPRVEPPEGPEPAPASEADEGDPAPSRILVVDDEPVVLRVLGRLLRRHGHQVDVVSDGVAALASVRELGPGGYDLVLLDLVMPGMSGAELLEALLALDPGLQVILSSGYAPLQAGLTKHPAVRGFLKKPFDRAMLSDLITEALTGGRG